MSSMDLRVQLGPRSYAHASVTGVLAAMLGGGFGPGRGVVALHLGPVATGASDVFRWVAQARVAVEAAPGAQAHEDLARAPLQSLLHLDGVVACIEDEQRGSVSPTRRKVPPQESPHLLSRDRVRVLRGSEALYLHG